MAKRTSVGRSHSILVSCSLVLLFEVDARIGAFNTLTARHQNLRSPSARYLESSSQTFDTNPNTTFLRLRGGVGTCDEKKVLILDVDGTLYGSDCNVEQQIVANIHKHAAEHYGLTKEQCDTMHTIHGSTFAGLKKCHLNNTDQEKAFYDEVYGSLNLSGLVSCHKANADETGYRHQSKLYQLLSGVKSLNFCASNSPLSHVNKVLAMLGLIEIGWSGVLTPDTRHGCTKGNKEFWQDLLQKYSPEKGYSLELIDDSERNLEIAASVGMQTMLVTSKFPVNQAILAHQGIIPRPADWRFDSLLYLRAKNVVDSQSFNTHVWSQVVEECERVPADQPLVVVDLGAGLLSMLDRMLTLPHDFIEYYAIETESDLQTANAHALIQAGYTLDADSPLGPRYVDPDRCSVTLISTDFRRLPAESLRAAHVFVACCFADLFPPDELLRGVTRLAGPANGALLYAPITFCGTTRLDPQQPRVGDVPGDMEVLEAYQRSLVVEQGHHTDPTALIAKARAMGAAVLAQGPSPWAIPWDGTQVGSSQGFRPARDSVSAESGQVCGRMWDSMLYFFGTGVASAAAERGWDLSGWVQRCRRVRPTIEALNVDLLLRLYDGRPLLAPPPSETLFHAHAPSTPLAAPPGHQASSERRQVLTFVAPRRVEVTEEDLEGVWPGAGQVVVRAVRSMVSSGTELKVFRGDMEADAQVDETIKGMTGCKMGYPLAYGYSLVGLVVAAGEGVAGGPAAWLGRRVFAFAAHGSHAVVDAGDVLPVPEGIPWEDACYLPAVETALSLVQQACPMVGTSALSH